MEFPWGKPVCHDQKVPFLCPVNLVAMGCGARPLMTNAMNEKSLVAENDPLSGVN